MFLDSGNSLGPKLDSLIHCAVCISLVSDGENFFSSKHDFPSRPAFSFPFPAGISLPLSDGNFSCCKLDFPMHSVSCISSFTFPAEIPLLPNGGNLSCPKLGFPTKFAVSAPFFPFPAGISLPLKGRTSPQFSVGLPYALYHWYFLASRWQKFSRIQA